MFNNGLFLYYFLFCYYMYIIYFKGYFILMYRKLYVLAPSSGLICSFMFSATWWGVKGGPETLNTPSTIQPQLLRLVSTIFIFLFLYFFRLAKPSTKNLILTQLVFKELGCTIHPPPKKNTQTFTIYTILNKPLCNF